MTLQIGKWRQVLAQDPATEEPSEGKLVQDFSKSPINNWEEFLQLIVRVLGLRLGAEIDLAGAAPKPGYGSTSTFTIDGTVQFKQERPLEVLKKYGKKQLRFSATIAAGKLVEPIVLSV